MRVVLSGYQVKQEKVSLTADTASRTVSYRLERQAPPPARRAAPSPARTPSPSSSRPYVGSVYVDSRPRGARVLIEGLDAARVGDLAHRERVSLHELASDDASLEQVFFSLTGEMETA